MTDKVKIVLRGFIELSNSEKEEIINEFQKYFNKGSVEKRIMDESLGAEVKRILGPTSVNNCPCCGK